jgi:hypothetical protein
MDVRLVALVMLGGCHAAQGPAQGLFDVGLPVDGAVDAATQGLVSTELMILAEESLPDSNRIVAYVAANPEGPWSAPVVVHDMADPAFRQTYCCAPENDCEGPQMFNCTRTGFYGTYLLPDVATTGTGFTVTYTMSSFSPYNVALFQTTFP